jgi:acyl-CoA synthetase (AMP-forming)/AMP-acid ligase II
MMMENSPEFIATWIGLVKIGAVPAFLNYNLRGREKEPF